MQSALCVKSTILSQILAKENVAAYVSEKLSCQGNTYDALKSNLVKYELNCTRDLSKILDSK